jgi:hypothetical protein
MHTKNIYYLYLSKTSVEALKDLSSLKLLLSNDKSFIYKVLFFFHLVKKVVCNKPFKITTPSYCLNAFLIKSTNTRK